MDDGLCPSIAFLTTAVVETRDARRERTNPFGKAGHTSVENPVLGERRDPVGGRVVL